MKKKQIKQLCLSLFRSAYSEPWTTFIIYETNNENIISIVRLLHYIPQLFYKKKIVTHWHSSVHVFLTISYIGEAAIYQV